MSALVALPATAAGFALQVGVIGLGRMGGRMARNIAKAGHALAIHDVRSEAVAALAELEATVCATPSAVAAVSEIVLTSLPGPQEVEVTMSGPAASWQGSGAAASKAPRPARSPS